jgi:hypothetical protein
MGGDIRRASMSTFTSAADRPGPDTGRAVVLVRNDTAERGSATVVLDGVETTTRQVGLSPGGVAVVAAPGSGPVVAAVHAEAASASFSFDPETATAPPLFSLRAERVLVSPK